MSKSKAALKARVCELIDTHYEEFEKKSNAPDFDISRIEQLMLQQQEKLRAAFLESNSELTSSLGKADKKLSQMLRT